MSDAQREHAPEAPRTGWKAKAGKLVWLVYEHARRHTGVGIVCAVAYLDPGNWGVDLQAGSEFGYRLLFVVLLAGLFAVFLQVLASRLGCVTGRDLASHCRLQLHSRPSHTLLWRWGALYPLYVLAEVAIIATDLAELLGSAIALNLLFPRLQLWHGVLITAFDVLLLLAFRDPLRGRPVRAFECGIAALVLTVMVCMCVVVSKTDVRWGEVFLGYLPSRSVVNGGAMYVSVGIIGATVMPHSLFVGSALATQDRLPEKVLADNPSEESLPAPATDREKDAQAFSFRSLTAGVKEFVASAFRKPPKSDLERPPRSLAFVRAHIYHGIVDVAISLLGFAVATNSLILILAGTVFYYGSNGPPTGSGDPASLFDAHALLRDLLGSGAATLFAIALLASGQSSSIIATMAGQAVCEGFLEWRMSAVTRRLVTRLIAMVPSVVVAVSGGREGVDRLLVASQVVLSVVLPFVCGPLLVLTSMRGVMRVPAQQQAAAERRDEHALEHALDERGSGREGRFENGKIVIVVGALVWALVVVANAYVLVRLAMGGE